MQIERLIGCCSCGLGLTQFDEHPCQLRKVFGTRRTQRHRALEQLSRCRRLAGCVGQQGQQEMSMRVTRSSAEQLFAEFLRSGEFAARQSTRGIFLPLLDRTRCDFRGVSRHGSVMLPWLA